jgi:hypothetical protein
MENINTNIKDYAILIGIYFITIGTSFIAITN